MDAEMRKQYVNGIRIFDCPYREGAVDCSWKWICDKCGWNPKVEEKRKEAIRKKLA